MTVADLPSAETLLWHQLAHAKLKPAERMDVLRAARTLDGEVADLGAWVAAGFPGVEAALGERFQTALESSASEGFLLDELQTQGMEVLTGRNNSYPKRFKKVFKDKTPVSLYAVGNTALLNARRTVAIVGSRDAGEDALALTCRAANHFVAEGYVLISGNARGVDQAAERAALDAGGGVISVLPQGVLDKASGALIRQRSRALLDGQQLLLSELHPKSRWQARFAMMRNRLIMALADVVVVAQTGAKESLVNGKKVQSGTWAGAQEAARLGKQVFVFDLPCEGNQLLAQEIATPLTPTNDQQMFFEIENSLLGEKKFPAVEELGEKKHRAKQPSLFTP